MKHYLRSLLLLFSLMITTAGWAQYPVSIKTPKVNSVGYEDYQSYYGKQSLLTVNFTMYDTNTAGVQLDYSSYGEYRLAYRIFFDPVESDEQEDYDSDRVHGLRNNYGTAQTKYINYSMYSWPNGDEILMYLTGDPNWEDGEWYDEYVPGQWKFILHPYCYPEDYERIGIQAVYYRVESGTAANGWQTNYYIEAVSKVAVWPNDGSDDEAKAVPQLPDIVYGQVGDCDNPIVDFYYSTVLEDGSTVSDYDLFYKVYVDNDPRTFNLQGDITQFVPVTYDGPGDYDNVFTDFYSYGDGLVEVVFDRLPGPPYPKYVGIQLFYGNSDDAPASEIAWWPARSFNPDGAQPKDPSIDDYYLEPDDDYAEIVFQLPYADTDGVAFNEDNAYYTFYANSENEPILFDINGEYTDKIPFTYVQESDMVELYDIDGSYYLLYNEYKDDYLQSYYYYLMVELAYPIERFGIQTFSGSKKSNIVWTGEDNTPVVLTPRAPQIVDPWLESSGMVEVGFKLPTTATDGTSLDRSKLYFQVFVNGALYDFAASSDYTFSNYNNFIPADYNDDYGLIWTSGDLQYVDIFLDDYNDYAEDVSLRAVYVDGANTTYSDFTRTLGLKRIDLSQSDGYMTLFYDDRSYTVPYGYVANVYAINSDNKLEIVRQYEAGTDFYKVPQEEAVVLTYADENNPAGTSIIYFDEPFDDYNAFIVETSGYESNLRGSNYGDTYDVWGRFYDFESKYYKLALGADGKAGFYWGAPDGGPFTLPEHRCFLAIPRDDAPAKIALDDTTTGITATESTDNDDNAPVYNIAGQRVNNAYKGLVIKNGKKTIVK